MFYLFVLQTYFSLSYDFKCLLNGFASLLYLHVLYNLKINKQLNSVITILKGM